MGRQKQSVRKSPKKRFAKKSIKKPYHLKKPHRFKPGTVALRNIRKQQRSTVLLFRRLPFQRVVREIAHEFLDDVKFQAHSMKVLQEAAENYIIELLRDSRMICLHSKRVTVCDRDVELALRLKKEFVSV